LIPVGWIGLAYVGAAEGEPALTCCLGSFYLPLFIGAIGVWKWKRWGTYLFVGYSLLWFALSCLMSAGVILAEGSGGGEAVAGAGTFLALVPPLILILLVRRFWSQME
jgi:hypothetical protein